MQRMLLQQTLQGNSPGIPSKQTHFASGWRPGAIPQFAGSRPNFRRWKSPNIARSKNCSAAALGDWCLLLFATRPRAGGIVNAVDRTCRGLPPVIDGAVIVLNA